MVYSDSHAHLGDYGTEQLARVLELMRNQQVELALVVAVNLDSSEGVIRLAQAYKQLPAAIGIHPWFAEKLTEAERQRFQELARSKYVKAIGEIGLDYAPPTAGDASREDMPDMKFPDNMPQLPNKPASKEVQQELLRFELSVALENRLPVNIHCSPGAHEDMIRILGDAVNQGLTGIAHGFIGTVDELHDWLDLGFYIAIGNIGMMVEVEDAPPLGFEKRPPLEAIVRATPLNRLLTETDANPTMAPDGSAAVIPVVQKIASILGDTAENIGNITTTNLKRLLEL